MNTKSDTEKRPQDWSRKEQFQTLTEIAMNNAATTTVKKYLYAPSYHYRLVYRGWHLSKSF